MVINLKNGTFSQKHRFLKKMTWPLTTDVFLVHQIVLYQKITTRTKSDRRKKNPRGRPPFSRNQPIMAKILHASVNIQGRYLSLIFSERTLFCDKNKPSLGILRLFLRKLEVILGDFGSFLGVRNLYFRVNF